mgnify:FL=1
MLKKIFSLLIILLVTHCGFTPIYNTSDKINYKINIVKVDGDKFLNNLISSEIKRISSSESSNIFNIKINTFYEKIILSKDIKGTASDYQLIIRSDFVIEKNNKIENVSFKEKQNIKNTSDIFEQKNYENTIKKNFAISIVRKLNLKLLNQQ